MSRIVQQKEGYKVITKADARSVIKKPFFCPVETCKRITSNLDDPYLLENGCCKTCYIMLVEDRQKPLIDVEYYKKRLQERGY